MVIPVYNVGIFLKNNNFTLSSQQLFLYFLCDASGLNAHSMLTIHPRAPTNLKANVAFLQEQNKKRSLSTILIFAEFLL